MALSHAAAVDFFENALDNALKDAWLLAFPPVDEKTMCTTCHKNKFTLEMLDKAREHYKKRFL